MSIALLSMTGVLSCLSFFFAGIVDSICGGGGLITIPVMLALGIPPHFVTGTNQVSCWLGTGVATIEYMKSGNIHYRSAVIAIPFAIAGGFLGAKLNLMLPERYLQWFMIISIPIITALLLLNRDLGEEDHIEHRKRSYVLAGASAIGFFLGAYQGFYGPGSGLLLVLAYAAVLKLNLVRATGNSKLVLTFAVLSSVLTYAFSGTVIWNLAIAAMICHMMGSYLGARLAINNGNRIIRPLMLIVVAMLFVKLLMDLLST